MVAAAYVKQPRRICDQPRRKQGRPFDPKVVQQAQALAARYEIHVERNSRGYVGTVTDLPTVFGVGTSKDAARSDARRQLKWALAYLIGAGRTPSPKPGA